MSFSLPASSITAFGFYFSKCITSGVHFSTLSLISKLRIGKQVLELVPVFTENRVITKKLDCFKNLIFFPIFRNSRSDSFFFFVATTATVRLSNFYCYRNFTIKFLTCLMFLMIFELIFLIKKQKLLYLDSDLFNYIQELSILFPIVKSKVNHNRILRVYTVYSRNDFS